MDALKQQVMANQFVYVTGCRLEQANQYLASTNWHFEMALSLFFQEAAIPCQGTNMNHTTCHFQTPTNTPVTPPSFPDTLASFSKLLNSTDKTKSSSTTITTTTTSSTTLPNAFTLQPHGSSQSSIMTTASNQQPPPGTFMSLID